MPAFIYIVFLALNIGKSGGAIQPVVTFTPNWGNILDGDSVTLTCDVPPTVPEEPRTYSWYKDHQPIPGDHQTRRISPSSLEDSGDYQCQTSASNISDPVTLNVTNNRLILQRPPSAIYEGDPLTLRCHHASGIFGTDVKFYKDNEEEKSEFPDSEFHIHKVDPTTAGRYKCTKLIRYSGTSDCYEHSDEFSVSVKELFSPPEIKVTPYRVIEGGNMTLACNTRLDPLRAGADLRFAFRRDGQIVRKLLKSNKYKVKPAQLEHSGNYTCEVKVVNVTTRKTSDGLYIQIYSKPPLVTILAVAIVGVLLVIAISAVIIWRCKNRKKSSASSQAAPQETTAMATKANPDPPDVCYTYLELGHMPKASKIRNDEEPVIYAIVRNPDI